MENQLCRPWTADQKSWLICHNFMVPELWWKKRCTYRRNCNISIIHTMKTAKAPSLNACRIFYYKSNENYLAGVHEISTYGNSETNTENSSDGLIECCWFCFLSPDKVCLKKNKKTFLLSWQASANIQNVWFSMLNL